MTTLTPPFVLRQRRTLRSWLSSVLRSLDHGLAAAQREVAAPVPPALLDPTIAPELSAMALRADGSTEPRGEVVAFPLHGEAVLVRLADVLRQRVAGRQPAHDPLWLTISRGPWTRLSIDRSAYVDYVSEAAVYRAAIEAAPDTKVILKTTNFEVLVSFVMQYIDDRLLDRTSVEATR